MHEHDGGNQSAGTRCRSARYDSVSSKGNVQGRAAPDRCVTVGSSHSASARFAAPRSAGANGPQLPGAQKPSARNRSTNKIFLGRVSLEDRRLDWQASSLPISLCTATGKMPVARVRLGSLTSVQPLHVIAHALFQGKPRFVTKRTAGVRQIGLSEILIMCVRIVDVIRLKTGPQAFV